MSFSTILYRFQIDEADTIAIEYDNSINQLVVHRNQVDRTVKAIEETWKKIGYVEAFNNLTNMQPRVAALGNNLDNLFLFGIIATRNFVVTKIEKLGVVKFHIVKCDGPNALKFWSYGREPRLPEKPDETV